MIWRQVIKARNNHLKIERIKGQGKNGNELFMLYMIELNGGVPEDIFDEWYLIGDHAHEAAY